MAPRFPGSQALSLLGSLSHNTIITTQTDRLLATRRLTLTWQIS